MKSSFLKMSQYFPKPFRRFEENINVKVDLWNYATKNDLKIANLASLKTEVDKLGIDKLAQVPVDLSKFSDFVRKTVYDKLAAKVHNIDTIDFVVKTKCQRDKTKLEKKIPDAIDFVKKTKLTELENKIPYVSILATNSSLTAVVNKIPCASSLVKKKTIYNTKISEFEKKLTDHNLITKTDFNTKLSSINNKIAEICLSKIN